MDFYFRKILGFGLISQEEYLEDFFIFLVFALKGGLEEEMLFFCLFKGILQRSQEVYFEPLSFRFEEILSKSTASIDCCYFWYWSDCFLWISKKTTNSFDSFSYNRVSVRSMDMKHFLHFLLPSFCACSKEMVLTVLFKPLQEISVW
mgnify:CR=1 FL=1